MAAVGSVDVEKLLIAWLTDRLGVDAVVQAELDNGLLADVPVVQVQHDTGTDDGFRLDRALVDVDVYAATRGDASALATRVRGLLLTQLRGSVTATAVVGMVATISSPSWRPYENTNVRRFGATYEIYTHPVS